MRLVSTLIFSLAFLSQSFGQIVINEIMYNPPESGTDSLEYIELYNVGASTNLEGYNFTQGFDYVFPNVDIAMGEYIVVCIDSAALANTLGITGCYQWESGALSNGGEDIILVDGQGNMIDVVDYQNGGEWPTEANGNGSSIELCNPLADNTLGENWKASKSGKGIVINGNEVKATPAAENDASCADHTVEVSNNVFTPDSLVINVGETVEWIAVEGFHNVNGSQATFPSNPEGFGNGAAAPAPWTYNYTFNTEGSYDYQCDPHQFLGMVGHIQVVDNPVPNIVITEIMYNNPGPDTVEFIELFNNSDEAVNLENFAFINGVDVTFGDITMDPMTYLVTAAYPSYMKDSFGVDAIEFTGSLNNAGETLELVDAQGRSVDRVTYDNAPPWDLDADGNGYSLILCDPSSDNASGLNWSKSTNETPIIIERRAIFCSPGSADSCAIAEERYPLYPIGTVTTVDVLGFPDSNNVTCAVQGIVHGVDLQGGTDIQFTLIDQSGGMGIYSDDNFNYTVQEGDELLLKGTVVAFNGLTQMNPDSLKVISTGGAPFTAVDVTTLDESTESELVRITGVSFINPNDWRGDGTSFNIDVSDGTNFYTLRIDDDTDLANRAIFPPGTMNITGIGGQFDRDEPFDEGYQLLPRYEADFDIEVSAEDLLLEQLQVFPNPVNEMLTIQGLTPGMTFDVVDVLGKVIQRDQRRTSVSIAGPVGVYFLKVHLGSSSKMFKLIKE